jgi:hypothetical protein
VAEVKQVLMAGFLTAMVEVSSFEVIPDAG